MAVAIKVLSTPTLVSKGIRKECRTKKSAAIIAAIQGLATQRNHNYMPRLIGAYLQLPVSLIKIARFESRR